MSFIWPVSLIQLLEMAYMCFKIGDSNLVPAFHKGSILELSPNLTNLEIKLLTTLTLCF